MNFHPSQLVSSSLKVPKIVTTQWQTVGKLVGHKFDLQTWWRNIGWQESEEKYDFRLRLGRVEVYADWTIPSKSEFRMLELAMLNTNWTAVLSTDEFKTFTKIRLERLWQPAFAYKEIE